jgi:hypothetical protein
MPKRIRDTSADECSSNINKMQKQNDLELWDNIETNKVDKEESNQIFDAFPNEILEMIAEYLESVGYLRTFSILSKRVCQVVRNFKFKSIKVINLGVDTIFYESKNIHVNRFEFCEGIFFFNF